MFFLKISTFDNPRCMAWNQKPSGIYHQFITICCYECDWRTSADDDSWGEVSEDSDVDDYVPRQRGKPSKQTAFPLPPMSFALVPVQHPGSLGYKQTPPKNAKRKDYLRRKTKPVFHPAKVIHSSLAVLNLNWKVLSLDKRCSTYLWSKPWA